MIKYKKYLFVFSVFLMILPGITGCTGGKTVIPVPMSIQELIGLWNGELNLSESDGVAFTSVMEIGEASGTCFATVTLVQTEERETDGFTDIRMQGEVMANQLLLSGHSDNTSVTYAATCAFMNRQKNRLSATISRRYVGGTSAVRITDNWQGDFVKWLDPENQPVEFEDPALEQAVRNADGFTGTATGAIYPDDITGIVQLSIVSGGITSLEGLQHLAGLQQLNAKQNSISDLSPLQELTELRLLNLSVNPVDDLSSLENLTNLECLRFYQTRVSDLTPLQQLTRLKTLDFADAAVDDLSPVQTLENLTYLNCGYNQVGDLAPLESLHSLQSIWLISNLIQDISPLFNNSELGEGDYLDIRNNLLDLTPGSEDMQHINSLVSRGVTVFYQNQ